MKPELKPPGTKLLKPKCDILLSTSAFKFNLRRHNLVAVDVRWGNVARLRVESTALKNRRTKHAWNVGLEHGFVVDYAVNPDKVEDLEHAMVEPCKLLCPNFRPL